MEPTMRVPMLSIALAACQEPAVELSSSSPEPEPTDLRREFPPPAEGGLQFVTPDYEIPPHSEVQLCVAVPYEGETMGIRAQHTYQSPGGHHVTVNGTNADDDVLPDGVAVDCSGADTEIMVSMDPMLVGGELESAEEGPEGRLELPDGMAARLPERTRIMLQSHYVNTTASPILVRDAVNLELVPEEEVQTWAAPLAVTEVDDLSIPLGPSVVEVDCPMQEELSVLFLGGHMHEWGSSFATLLDGEVIYEIPQWDPQFRDAPVYADLGAGLTLQPGSVLTTRCAYDNTTDHVLEFPEEMCVTFAMVYPTKLPIICDPG
jgi:hypothetical protein